MWDLSFLTRDWTCIFCFGRWILNYWTTREVPKYFFLHKKRQTTDKNGRRALPQGCRFSSLDSFPLSLATWEDSLLSGLSCFPLLFSQRPVLLNLFPKTEFDQWILGTSSSPQLPEEVEIFHRPCLYTFAFPWATKEGMTRKGWVLSCGGKKVSVEGG